MYTCKKRNHRISYNMAVLSLWPNVKCNQAQYHVLDLLLCEAHVSGTLYEGPRSALQSITVCNVYRKFLLARVAPSKDGRAQICINSSALRDIDFRKQ
jgi:hypothetical protein